MTKKTEHQSEFVTQSQWTEGMQMIEDFFGKVISEVQGVKTKVSNMESDIKTVKKQITGLVTDNKVIKRQIASLEFEVTDFRQEQRLTNSELDAKIESNTDAASSLTQELREARKIEFTVFNHEGRITKLEKAR